MGLSISEFAEKLDQVIGSLWREFFKRQADALTKGKITFPQYICLDLLNQQGNLKMKEIAGQLDISFPAATGMIKRLIALHYVIRVYDKNDRRVIHIHLTSRGKAILQNVKELRIRLVQEVFGKLTGTEREQYLQIVQKLERIVHGMQ